MKWWVNRWWRLLTTISSPNWTFKSHNLCKGVCGITRSSKNLGGGRIKKGAESRTKHSIFYLSIYAPVHAGRGTFSLLSFLPLQYHWGYQVCHAGPVDRSVWKRLIRGCPRSSHGRLEWWMSEGGNVKAEWMNELGVSGWEWVSARVSEWVSECGWKNGYGVKERELCE